MAASVAYRAGQRDDPEGFGGLAHFVEHLMFAGSRKVGPGEHFASLERAGATRISGRTSLDRTTFSSEVPRHVWRLPLWLESERMAYLLSRIDDAAVDKERAVILNEAYQRGQHLAWGTHWVTASQALFPEGHPYHLDRATRSARSGSSTCRFFFQTHHGPNRATVALVGAFEPQQARETIERYFAGIRNSFDAPPATRGQYAPLAETKFVDLRANVLAESVVVAWPVPAQFTKAAPRFSVLAEYLRNMQAFRYALREAAVDDFGITFDANEFGSVFWVEVAMREDDRTDGIHSVIQRELGRLALELDPGDLLLARKRVVVHWARLADDFAARANFLAEYGRQHR